MRVQRHGSNPHLQAIVKQRALLLVNRHARHGQQRIAAAIEQLQQLDLELL